MVIQNDILINMLERTPKSPPKIAPLAPNSDQPQWSVMIPSYNCIQYLRKTIESVLVQALDTKQMQIEVIDDFSTDGNVRALVKEIGNDRVGFYRQPCNVGSLRNFETCINRSRGKFVHILHGDDLVMPGFYEEIGELIDEHPDAGALFTNWSGIDNNEEWLWDGKKMLNEPGIVDNLLLKLAEGPLLQTPCIVVKREVYEKLGSFFGVHYGEDWEMWTRIAAHYKVAYSPKTLACYRIHNNNISGNSFVTGQNINDIVNVIDTIQNYLPKEHRKVLKNKARQNYAYYVTTILDMLHNTNKSKSALLQACKAFQLYPNAQTFRSLIKITAKIVFRYRKSEIQ